MRVRLLAATSAASLFAGLVALAPSARAIDTPIFQDSVFLRCVKVTGSNCSQNLEPELKVDGDGNAYVAAITGVPGGVNLWKRAAGDTKFEYAGMPDALPGPLTTTTGVTPGGGDIAVAVAPVKNTSGNYNVYLSSLWLGSTTVATSRDKGATFTDNYTAALPMAGVDREWVAAEGAETVYQMFDDLTTHQLWINKSTDGGATFTGFAPVITDPNAAAIVALSGSRYSQLWRDPSSGNLMIVFTGRGDVVESARAARTLPAPAPQPAERHRLWLASCTTALVCTVSDIFTEPDPTTRVDADFPWISTDAAGKVYAVWTTTKGVFMATSSTGGASFAAPVRVDDATLGSFVFPAVVAGDSGNVGVAFLGSTATSLDDATAVWDVYYSVSINGGANFTQVKASDEPAHVGGICLRGLGCDLPDPVGQPGDRTLAEVVTITLDTDGMPIIAYPISRRHGASLGAGQSAIVKQRGGQRLVASTAVVALIDEVLPPPVIFGPLEATTLHFDSSSPVGEADRVVEFGAGSGGPFLTTAVPTGPRKVQETTRNGNPGFNANPLLAHFTFSNPLKTDETVQPTVDVWLVAPENEVPTEMTDPLPLSVEVFVDGLPRYGHDEAGTWIPIQFPVHVGAQPTLVHLTLPALNATALSSFVLQFGVSAPTAQPHAPLVVYGDPDFDSRLNLTAAFAAGAGGAGGPTLLPSIPDPV